jgi:hypothetical protein
VVLRTEMTNSTVVIIPLQRAAANISEQAYQLGALMGDHQLFSLMTEHKES